MDIRVSVCSRSHRSVCTVRPELPSAPLCRGCAGAEDQAQHLAQKRVRPAGCVPCPRACLLCLQDYEDDFEVCDGADDSGADEPREGEAAEELSPARRREIQEVQKAILAENQRVGELPPKLPEKHCCPERAGAPGRVRE